VFPHRGGALAGGTIVGGVKRWTQDGEARPAGHGRSRAKSNTANPPPGDPEGVMRRIVANFFISLDGVVESPDQWHFPYFDEQMGAAIGAGIAASDALLMGRQNYEEWAAYWPTSADEPFASQMNGMRKYVVSSTTACSTSSICWSTRSSWARAGASSSRAARPCGSSW
jgi:hypothetical protein